MWMGPISISRWFQHLALPSSNGFTSNQLSMAWSAHRSCCPPFIAHHLLYMTRCHSQWLSLSMSVNVIRPHSDHTWKLHRSLAPFPRVIAILQVTRIVEDCHGNCFCSLYSSFGSRTFIIHKAVRKIRAWTASIRFYLLVNKVSWLANKWEKRFNWRAHITGKHSGMMCELFAPRINYKQTAEGVNSPAGLYSRIFLNLHFDVSFGNSVNFYVKFSTFHDFGSFFKNISTVTWISINQSTSITSPILMLIDYIYIERKYRLDAVRQSVRKLGPTLCFVRLLQSISRLQTTNWFVCSTTSPIRSQKVLQVNWHAKDSKYTLIRAKHWRLLLKYLLKANEMRARLARAEKTRRLITSVYLPSDSCSFKWGWSKTRAKFTVTNKTQALGTVNTTKCG